MKKFLVTMGLVAFAFVGCDDSSSASVGPNDEPGIESSSSSSGKVTEPAEVTSSSSSVDTINSSSLQGDKNSSSSGQNEASSSSLSSSSLKSESSSSDENSQSSSSKGPELAEESFTDPRDGQTYKTVTIGTQRWMAENLNYGTANSYCYNDNSVNCAKYGRLYTWAAAMDSSGTWSTNGKGCGYNKTCSPTYPVRGVCPEGWHLPSITEFEPLFTAVGGSSTAGTALKSTSGWYNDGNGTDAFGFSALPAGLRDSYGDYYDEGSIAHFWSSTEDGSGCAYDMYLNYNYDYAYLNYNDKYRGLSVRCLKD